MSGNVVGNAVGTYSQEMLSSFVSENIVWKQCYWEMIRLKIEGCSMETGGKKEIFETHIEGIMLPRNVETVETSSL